MKRKIIIVGTLIIFVVAFLSSINASIDRPNKYKNGFTRNFLNLHVNKIASLKCSNDLYDLCGHRNDTVFFSHKLPGKISYTYGNYSKLNSLEIKLPRIEGLTPVFYTFLDYPNIYILGGNARKVIKGNITNGKYGITDVHLGSFYNAITIDDHNFMVRAIDTATLNEAFYKIVISKNKIIRDTDLSEKLRDAGIIHDGMLNYDRQCKRFVYVDFYSNQVTCFNENFRLLYRSRTIDTTNTSSAIPVKKGNSITNSVPPIMVNYYSDLNNCRLYVQSELVADNEDHHIFSDSSVIDVYNAGNGNYIGSFRIPVTSKAIISLKVFNNKIYVLTAGTITIYQLINNNPKDPDLFIY